MEDKCKCDEECKCKDNCKCEDNCKCNEKDKCSKDKDDCEELEKQYEQVRQKYSLPSFSELSEEFDIEKLCEKSSSFIIRDIRRAVFEKISAYLHFFETLSNPSSPPIFIFTILKNLEEKDRDKIKDLYKEFSKMQIRVMKLDTVYNEKNEAEFISTTFIDWQKKKHEILKLIEKFEEKLNQDNNYSSKGYFG